jgi:5-methylcytosine-specific restriction enzyme subunit McrC
VIYNSNTQKAIAVLDTKYKTPDKPSNNDINQILAYAHFKQVKQAILIYPEKLQYHLGEVIHNVHIKTLNFSLDESPDKTGKTFLDSLFPL